MRNRYTQQQICLMNQLQQLWAQLYTGHGSLSSAQPQA